MPEAAVAEPLWPSTSTVRLALRVGAVSLAAAGCDTPRLDAELLLCAALGDGWSRAQLLMVDLEQLDRAAIDRYEGLLARRRAREPVAYIVGRKDFRHISLAVDRRVLIPRPETELLVEAGLTLAGEASVADVGTGSGAVALALKHERPDLELTGIDVSADALAVARDNARRLGLDVAFVQADLLDADRYDAVLANLPYVPARGGELGVPGGGGLGVGGGELGVPGGDELAPEITRYEPARALYAGADGLGALRRLISRLEGTAVRVVALEVGVGQASEVAGLLAGVGFGSIERLRDLAGHERVLVGRR